MDERDELDRLCNQEAGELSEMANRLLALGNRFIEMGRDGESGTSQRASGRGLLEDADRANARAAAMRNGRTDDDLLDEERDRYWHDGLDTIPRPTNYSLPRWVRDKVRAAAQWEGIEGRDTDQSEIVARAIVREIERMERERGRAYDFVPLKTDAERGPSF